MLIVAFPEVFITKYEDNACISRATFKSKHLKSLMTAFVLYQFVLNYVIPVTCFSLMYGAVIWAFRNRGKSTELAASRVIDKATKELTKTAIIVTVIFITTMAFAFWYFLLGNLGVFPFAVSSVFSKISFWLISINNTANPFVYALLMPAYRRSVRRTFCNKD